MELTPDILFQLTATDCEECQDMLVHNHSSMFQKEESSVMNL